MTQRATEELRTIPDILNAQADAHPTAAALIGTNGEVLSYEQLRNDTQALASTLFAHGPQTAGLRVGVVMPNGLDISVVLLAVARNGIAVPFNPAQTAVEFEAQFTATAVHCVLVPKDAQTPAQDAAAALSIPVIELTADRALEAPPTPKQKLIPANADDIALILMTSGSTGTPKIVPLTHRNLCRSALDVGRSLSLTPQDKCLVMWEQFHIGGLVDLLLAPLAAGGSIVAAGSFDAERFFDLQAEHRATWFQGVPTSLVALLHVAQQRGIKAPLPHLRFLRSVAAALSPAALERLRHQFQIPVVRTLGMTEAAPLITTTSLSGTDDKPGSVGKSAGPDVQILSDDGAVLTHGETGQVAIKGENVFAGYEGDTAANQAAFLSGWFLTGDLGYIDGDGDLFLTGRAKEMINRGGEKISPNEVDDALSAYPAVHEAASFAVPHGTLGEDIACAIAVADTHSFDVADLRRFLATRLAKHKIPARIDVLAGLPRNPVGKIDKQALAARRATDQPRATNDGPLTPLQKLVADIWKRELSLVDVGLDDDFASVDGDSLSAVRILVELETVFGVALPDEIVENFATVRGIATGLEAHGLEVANTAAENTPKSADHQSLLAEQFTFSGDLDDARTLIEQASGRADLRLKLDYIVAHLAPAKVARILDSLKNVTAGQANTDIGMIGRMRMRMEFGARLTALKRFLPDAGAPQTWQREMLAPGVLLYTDPSRPAAEKTLVVGFSGNRMRLLMPTFRFLNEIDPESCDVLLMIDHTRNLFFKGLSGFGDSPAAVAAHLEQFSARQGYKRLIAVGTSGGSLAALHIGISGNFDVVASVAPASIGKHPEWIPLFEEVTARHDPDKTPIRVIYGRRARHRTCADEIAHFLPFAEQIRYPYAGKNIFPDAQDRGELKTLLDKWIA